MEGEKGETKFVAKRKLPESFAKLPAASGKSTNETDRLNERTKSYGRIERLIYLKKKEKMRKKKNNFFFFNGNFAYKIKQFQFSLVRFSSV